MNNTVNPCISWLTSHFTMYFKISSFEYIVILNIELFQDGKTLLTLRLREVAVDEASLLIKFSIQRYTESGYIDLHNPRENGAKQKVLHANRYSPIL